MKSKLLASPGRIGVFTLVSVLAVAILVTACQPPRRTLSTEDKLSDMYWLYSQFNENYAPLEYKQQRFGFDYTALKAKYIQDAQATKTNDEFYKLMYQFVSEFKDAHTSAAMTSPGLPGRAKVAYLGFGGKRKGDRLVVTDMLPTMGGEGSVYPVKIGDQITKLDGVDLKTVVLTEMVKFRNLGQEESNLTYHMNRIFNRVSISNGQPTSPDAQLTFVRDGKELNATVPWIVKDVLTFLAEQKAAVPQKKTAEATGATGGFQIGFLSLDGQVSSLMAMLTKFVRGGPGFNFWDTFMFIDDSPSWSKKPIEGIGLEALAKERVVPGNAIPIVDAKTFPTYVSREKILAADGKETGATKLVAYMHLSSFSPGAPEKDVLDETKAALSALKDLGVNELIIDMINNGGGSLSLGMKLAQLFSSTKVVMPEMQFRLSETWLDEFEKESRDGSDDAEQDLAARVLKIFKDDSLAGKRLSRKLNAETLLVFPFAPNDKLPAKLNIVLLTNEMCASMCDIFTAIMKDNGLAKVVGAKTMGAGGNVVDHQAAPNSHLSVRQTESLILRRDGTTYIENNGIEPDFAMNVNESVMEKYEPVRKKALSVLLTN